MMKIRTRHPVGLAKSCLQTVIHWSRRNPQVVELLFPVGIAVAIVILEVLL